MEFGEDRVSFPIILVMVMLNSPACGAFGRIGLVPWVMFRGWGRELPVAKLLICTCTPDPANVMVAW